MFWVSAIKICEKIHWDFVVYWISAIFLPIFSIFQCIPPVFTPMYTIKLILHTFTYHAEHVITLEYHLIIVYFVWAAIIILIWLYPTWLRIWGSGSLVESKWCHYVIVEADSHLKLLPTSMCDIYKVFEHINMLFIGIQYHPYTIIPTLLGSDSGILGHLWSLNDVIMSWLRLTATSNCFPHPF